MAGGRAVSVVVLLVLGAACESDTRAGTSTVAEASPTDNPADDRAAAGGDAGTVTIGGTGAFAQPMPGLSIEERRAFAVGNSFFNQNWVTAPASTEGRDGLGPLFNAQSCSSCHEFDGRGQPPADLADPERGLLLRLSVEQPDGAVTPDPTYGGQLQDRALNGVAPEGRIVIDYEPVTGSYADGTPYELQEPTYTIDQLAYGPLSEGVMVSARVAPAVFGVGLLEAVPAADIEARADPGDADGDGVSGRVNRVPDGDGGTRLGRFGWKANVATVADQVLGAFHGDIGITSAAHPDQDCTAAQVDCAAAPDGGTPELDGTREERVVFYNRTLAVPARRDVGAAVTYAGERLFTELGCSSCHTATMQTASTADVAALAGQTIHPYTDLLLHDMGPGLADGRPDHDANGSEWRTAPLWGIGLVDEVNGHTRYLHDGRARDLEEAVLWHGGEAAAAQRAFTELPAGQRAQLMAFLESL